MWGTTLPGSPAHFLSPDTRPIQKDGHHLYCLHTGDGGKEIADYHADEDGDGTLRGQRFVER